MVEWLCKIWGSRGITVGTRQATHVIARLECRGNFLSSPDLSLNSHLRPPRSSDFLAEVSPACFRRFQVSLVRCNGEQALLVASVASGPERAQKGRTEEPGRTQKQRTLRERAARPGASCRTLRLAGTLSVLSASRCARVHASAALPSRARPCLLPDLHTHCNHADILSRPLKLLSSPSRPSSLSWTASSCSASSPTPYVAARTSTPTPSHLHSSSHTSFSTLLYSFSRSFYLIELLALPRLLPFHSRSSPTPTNPTPENRLRNLPPHLSNLESSP